MNDSWSWANGSKCHEYLKVVDEKNDFGLWAKGSECYEQLRAMYDMSDSSSQA